VQTALTRSIRVRDPNAVEKNRRAERKADAQAGLKVIETPVDNVSSPMCASYSGWRE
jgi:uncharacterized protein YlaN (UPF0358 family)